MTEHTALITGINGQDGAYLAAHLIGRGMRVVGTVPPALTGPLYALDALFGAEWPSHLTIQRIDSTDAAALIRLVRDTLPDRIFNLAALSYVPDSFDNPAATLNVNGLGTLHLLEAVRLSGRAAEIRFYQASSSELFGEAPAPQSETTPMHPLSPYAASKLYAYHLVRLYRQAYGLFAANGILFNHESPLRPDLFVTQKIIKAALRAKAGDAAPLRLGNISAQRDWSHADDMIRGMIAILDHARADDFVLGSGTAHSVQDFTDRAFAAVGLPVRWHGTGHGRQAIDADGIIRVVIDPALVRPADVPVLLADPAKARHILGWTPRWTLDDLIHDMIEGGRALSHAALLSDVTIEPRPRLSIVR